MSKQPTENKPEIPPPSPLCTGCESGQVAWLAKCCFGIRGKHPQVGRRAPEIVAPSATQPMLKEQPIFEQLANWFSSWRHQNTADEN
jgi:hypothetical protein